MPEVGKQEILDEIRRTAAANGGKPLGARRFEEVTGIGTSAWGRHWPRFGDAQRDAGLEPNKLNPAFGEEFLIRKYIGLMRELGKVPVSREVRLQGHRDPEFPSHNTFTRLGAKNDLVGKVIDYCRGKSEYADIVALCEAVYRPAMPARTSPDGLGDAELASGFVYLAKGHPGQYKIGRTNLVDRRLFELGVAAAVEPELVHEIKTDDPFGVEAYWHRRFEEKRLRGEWFKLNSADVKAFKRWRRIY